MIWATVSPWSCFYWLYRASPSLAAKNIINLILVLTIWWCPCVKSSGMDWNHLEASGDWNGKVGSQELPAVTGKFGLGLQNEGQQRLIEFYQENTVVTANTLFQQHKRWLYTWMSPDGQYWNQTKETHVQFLGAKSPWGRKRQPTPAFLPGKFHEQRSLAGYSPWGQRVRHSWVTKHI